MRTFELALFISVCLVLIAWLTRKRSLMWPSRSLGYAPVILLSLHVMIEGRRWPLWPMYLIAGIVFTVQAVSDLRDPDHTKSRQKWSRILGNAVVLSGLVISVISMAAAYSLPVFELPQPTGSYPVCTARLHLFPLVFYSPSGFVSRATAPCEELASHGYVIAAVCNPYWNAYTWDPLGLVTVNDRNNLYYSQMWQRGADSKLRLYRELNQAMPAEVGDIREWSEDISFLIDPFEKQKTGSYELADMLDLNRVGVIGFSKGGAAEGQVCLDDRRIAAGVNLDGFMFGDIVNRGISCPFLFVHSEPFRADASSRC